MVRSVNQEGGVGGEEEGGLRDVMGLADPRDGMHGRDQLQDLGVRSLNVNQMDGRGAEPEG